MIKNASITYSLSDGSLHGPDGTILKNVKQIQDTRRIYANSVGLTDDQLEAINYRTEVYTPETTEGSLQFATSYVYPGTVNGEFFMTKGHFHEVSNRSEFYLCLSGEGLLVFMDRNRHWWAERMQKNSLHYIPGHVAHRMINTGSQILSVQACWNSDAGHDYGTIENQGFPVRFYDREGQLHIEEQD